MAAKLPAGGEKPGVHPHESGDADSTPTLDVIEIAGAMHKIALEVANADRIGWPFRAGS